MMALRLAGVGALPFAGENTLYFLPDICSEDKSLLHRLEAARKQRDEENKQDIDGLSEAFRR